MYRQIFPLLSLSVLLTACSSDIQVTEVGRSFQCVDYGVTEVELGRQAYAEQCSVCHGDTGQMPQPGSRLLNPSNQFEYQALRTRIDTTMPPIDTGACAGECADYVAQYILNSWCVDSDDSSSSSSAASSLSSSESSSSSSVESSSSPSSSSQTSSSTSSSTVSSSSSTTSSSTSSNDNGLVANAGAEQGLAPWTTVGENEVLDQSQLQFYSGNFSFFVTNRQLTYEGLGQSLSGLMAGYDYQVSAWLYVDSPSPENVLITARENTTNMAQSATNYKPIANAAVANNWTQLSGIYTLNYEGSLDELFVYVEGPAANVDFYMDDFSIELIGPNLVVAGQKEYADQGCAGCHGKGINMGIVPQYNIDPNELHHTDSDGMAEYIRTQMPPGREVECEATCAESTAAYIKSWQ